MSLRCRIDIGLMGTMDHKDLVSFYESSSRFAAAGWRVDWYEDVTKLADEVQEFSAMIPPYEFYEKFYHVVDLGLLLLETFRGETPVKSVKLHMHNSIVPSYQIQAHHEYVCGTTAQVFSEAWNHIRSVTSMLRNVVRALGLSPTIDTWTVRFKSDNGSGDICLRETLKTTSDLITTIRHKEYSSLNRHLQYHDRRFFVDLRSRGTRLANCPEGGHIFLATQSRIMRMRSALLC